MPFVSEAQRRWMFKNRPEMAAEWAAETPDSAALPERAKRGSAPKRTKYGEARLSRSSSLR